MNIEKWIWRFRFTYLIVLGLTGIAGFVGVLYFFFQLDYMRAFWALLIFAFMKEGFNDALEKYRKEAHSNENK